MRVGGGGLPGGEVTIDASRSSQYVSALLLAAPFAARDLALRFADGVLVSRPYVELTLQVMRAFGAEADWSDGGKGLAVRAGRPYRGPRFAVEPDASAAAYPFCAAAIAGGQRAGGRHPRGLGAGGLRAARHPRAHGLPGPPRRAISPRSTGPPGPLRGIDVDMNDLPDAVLALAVAALFAEGETCIRNVANLRIKETDRLAALETELRKLGGGRPSRRRIHSASRRARRGRPRSRPTTTTAWRWPSRWRACAFPASRSWIRGVSRRPGPSTFPFSNACRKRPGAARRRQ